MNKERGLSKRKRKQKLVVAGCMSQRFSKELPGALPEVDAFMGLDEVTRVAELIDDLFVNDKEKVRRHKQEFNAPRSVYVPDYDTPRFRLTPKHYAYIKIAEGCNHPCSFCIIPQIRGRHRSRSIDSVVKEAQQLVREGVREINLISQDTTFFGMDSWSDRVGPRTPVDSTKGESLASLLRALQNIEGDFWVRLLYTHPAHWSDELIATIAACNKVARYVDMPLQHISNRMLDRMKRETSGDYIRDLVLRIREGIPGVTLRTTFIVGFPGETDEDFSELMSFIETARFERLGVFRYSQEEGTRAAKMEHQIKEKVKEKRWHEAMALQREIALEKAKQFVGKKIKVLIDKQGIARSEGDAPEIDGVVYVPEILSTGEFRTVRVVDSDEYDLVAEVCE
jgi:ribosomal protein S12 methylthiotransferase